MARPKGAKGKKKHVFVDPDLEEIVEMIVETKNPVTGEIIRQKVKVKRFKTIKRDSKDFIGASSILDDIEKEETLSSNDIDLESE